MADTTITVADVITEFGSFYIDGGQSVNNLLTRPFFPFGTREAFTNIPTTATQLRYSDVQVQKILQPFQKAFTPQGGVTFKPVTIDLQPVKIDEQFEPSELVYSWLGFLTNLDNDIDRKNWPFTRWLIEYYLMNQSIEDLEVDVIYKGVKAAVVPGTPGAPADTINGAKKLINDAITAATITPINTGAPAGAAKDWCTQIEEFVKSVPERFRNTVMGLNMSQDLYIKYTEGRAEKYNMTYSQESNLQTVRSFPNITVKGRTSMSASNKIWMTPIQNAIFATKGFSNVTGFKIEGVDRNVKIWTDFHIGLGFLLGDLVFTNDQDLV